MKIDREGGVVSKGKELAILEGLLNRIEAGERFAQGPDYWIKIKNGLESQVVTLISQDKIELLCFGADENHPDHHLVGQLSIDLEASDEEVRVTNYIETYARNFKYGLALELVEQDILQRMANELNRKIVQKIDDANKHHIELTAGMRTAWLKLYGSHGYFGFDEKGEKVFSPSDTDKKGLTGVGSIEISSEKNESGTLSITKNADRTAESNIRSSGEDLVILLKLLLNSRQESNPVADRF